MERLPLQVVDDVEYSDLPRAAEAAASVDRQLIINSEVLVLARIHHDLYVLPSIALFFVDN